MSLLPVRPDSPEPPYEQLRAQVVRLVERGELLPGSRLPPVRRVAEDLGLAPNTVARAYRELERAGVVETDGRRGTFVVEQAGERQRRGVEETHRYVSTMGDLGFAPADALALLRREVDRRDREGSAPGASR